MAKKKGGFGALLYGNYNAKNLWHWCISRYRRCAF